MWQPYLRKRRNIIPPEQRHVFAKGRWNMQAGSCDAASYAGPLVVVGFPQISQQSRAGSGLSSCTILVLKMILSHGVWQCKSFRD